MKELNIGKIIAEKRKRKGATQDEVAEYTGVSKASVSKWENGQSYPDITILPRLATYFNISIDELLGYRPQLADKEVQRKYREFSRNFAEKPFLEALEEARAFVRKYDSCFSLLLYMAQLYLNNYMLAPSKEEGMLVLEEACELCERIERECEDILLKKDAVSMKAVICLMKGEPGQVLELLGSRVRPALPTDNLVILAYQMLGEGERAMEYTQAALYQLLVNLLEYLGLYYSLAGAEGKEEVFERIQKLAGAFGLEELLPHKLISFFYSQAIHYAGQREEEKTLEALERYVSLAERQWKNFCIHGDNGFFDRLELWLEESGMGDYQMPRDIVLMFRDLAKALKQQPEFGFCRETSRFLLLEKRMDAVVEKAQKAQEVKK